MALNLLSMFGVASGLLDIFGGTKKKKDNSKIANAQEKLVNQRYEYNKKEVDEALEENSRNTYAAYAIQRMGIINSAKDEVSKINAYGGTAQNIEMGGSSVMLDALKEANTNLDNNLKNSFQNQDNALKTLVQENINTNYQLQTNLSDQIVNIKTKQAQLNAQADQEIMNGLIGVGTSAFDLWNSSVGSKTSLTNIQNENFGNYLNSNFSTMLYPQNTYQNPYSVLNSMNTSNSYLSNYFTSNKRTGLGG